MSPFFRPRPLVALLVAACGADETLFGADAAGLDLTDAVAVELEAVPRLDLLFVIDNTGDMDVSQAALVASFPRLLDDIGDETAVHIGVVSSDMGIGGYVAGGCAGQGDRGALQDEPRSACAPPSDSFISREWDEASGMEVKNYTGTLEDTFACIAPLGTDGCGIEQHLDAMKSALDDDLNPENAQFIRPDAWLGVVILADEDDCSAEDASVFDPSQDDLGDPLGPFSSFRCAEFGVWCGGAIDRSAGSYAGCEPMPDSSTNYIRHPRHHVDLLRQLKKGGVIATAIVGDPEPFGVELDPDGTPRLEPSCGTTDDARLAAPAVRLAWFAEAFGAQGAFSSICQDDLSPAVDVLGAVLSDALADPCITTAIDLTDRSDAPGHQLACEVSADGHLLPDCDLSAEGYPLARNARCWWAEVDNGLCPGAMLHVENAGREVTLGARCLL